MRRFVIIILFNICVLTLSSCKPDENIEFSGDKRFETVEDLNSFIQEMGFVSNETTMSCYMDLVYNASVFYAGEGFTIYSKQHLSDLIIGTTIDGDRKILLLPDFLDYDYYIYNFDFPEISVVRQKIEQYNENSNEDIRLLELFDDSYYVYSLTEDQISQSSSEFGVIASPFILYLGHFGEMEFETEVFLLLSSDGEYRVFLSDIDDISLIQKPLYSFSVS